MNSPPLATLPGTDVDTGTSALLAPRALPAGLTPEPRWADLGSAFSAVVPTEAVADPRLAAFSPACAAAVGWPSSTDAPGDVATAFADWLPVLAGRQGVEGFTPPRATVYSGHQFGHYVPRLGDGRAHTVAEFTGPRGHWEMQLKGAGPTPFSRHADGRAVLRSTLREFLCSEAMAALGVPTTRALAVAAAPATRVRRETVEPAAVLARLAPTHIRFGHFEYCYYNGQHERLRELADHVVAHHFPEIAAEPDPVARYTAFLTEVGRRTAHLMAQWQTVGFCHGVMNTDNFSILGLTLDYGPFGFLDQFQAGFICNHSDEGGRYAWDQQPLIGHWNFSRLIQACLPLLGEVSKDNEPRLLADAQALLATFPPAYTASTLDRWRAKLGLSEAQDTDAALVNGLLTVLEDRGTDFPAFFRVLATFAARTDGDADAGPLAALAGISVLPPDDTFKNWLADWRVRLVAEGRDDATRRAAQDAVNPKYVLRNHLAQRAIDAATAGDDTVTQRLYDILQRPFTDQGPGAEDIARPPRPDEILPAPSCSS